MKKGAIFDMDGLLFDTERLYEESWGYMALEFGQVPNPAFPKAVAGTSGAHMLDVIHAHYPAVDPTEFQQAGFRRVRSLLEQEVPEKVGAREILEMFAQNGVKMAVASSSPAETIQHNLKLSGLERYFEVVAYGAQVEHGKPAPDIFLLAAEKLGLNAKDCYVFEDSFNGIRAGAAAGCATVMIPDCVQPTEEIRALCSAVCGTLKEAKTQIEMGAL